MLLKNIALLFGGSAGSQLILLIMLPLLTRHYTASAFGEWAVFVAISSTLGVVSALKFDAAILLPKKLTETLRIIKIALLMVAAVTILATLLVIVLILSKSVDGYIYLFIPLMGLITGTTQILVVYLNRNKNYKVIAKSKLIQSISTALTNIICIYLINNENASWQLIVSTLIGQIVGLSSMLYVTLSVKVVCGCKKWINPIIQKRIIYRYRDFPLYAMPEATVGLLSSMLPLYAVGYMFTTQEAGQVALCWRVLMFPTAIIGGAATTVLSQRFAEKLSNSKKITGDILKVWALALLVGLIPAIAIANYGQEIIAIVFGAGWVLAGQLVEALSIYIYLAFSFSLTSGAHVALRMQHLSLVFAIIMLAAKTLLAWLGGMGVESLITAFLVVDLIGVIGMNGLALVKSMERRI